MDDLEDRLRRDPVLAAMRALQVEPVRALEIGCGNGYRLDALRRLYGARCSGLEPSTQAVEDAAARFPDVEVQVGTADALPFDAGAMDTVIFGFCLYLCDRADLFKIAAEADRVVAEGGLIYIYDFFSPGVAYRNPYAHHPGVYSYKMDYSRLFLGNPAYTQVYHALVPSDGGTPTMDPNERVAVTVVQKNLGAAYPHNPFSG